MKNGRDAYAETVLRRAIRHNKQALKKIRSLIQDAYKVYYEGYGFKYEGHDKLVMRNVLWGFSFGERNDLVSFYYVPEKKKYIGMVTNIVKATFTPSSSLLKELVIELNEEYKKVISLKDGERND